MFCTAKFKYKTCKYLGGISEVPQALYKIEYYIVLGGGRGLLLYAKIWSNCKSCKKYLGPQPKTANFKYKTPGDIVRDVRDVRGI